LYTNNLLKKIFKDIDIYAKITEHWHLNKIKNDFKSINLDNFIESFNQTYPQYLTMSQVRKETLDKYWKQDLGGSDNPGHPRPNTRRRKPSYSD
jgi:hypothetical protein